MSTTTKLAPLLAALALAACGGDDEAMPASREEAAFDGAVRFARCMREHGVDFPDPRRTGGGAVRMGAPHLAADPEDPKVRRAQQSCHRHLQAGGGPARSPQEQAELRDAFVRYARCMRRQGVDVPDPGAGQAGIVVRAGDGPDPSSPAFKAADARCDHLLADVEAGTPERSR